MSHYFINGLQEPIDDSMVIKEFRGPFAFLSNFFLASMFEFCSFFGINITYASNEHRFQAHKTLNKEEHLAIASAPNPAIAKKMGSTKGYMMPNGVLFKVTLRPDWDNVVVGGVKVKNRVMKDGVWLKFNQVGGLGAMLIDTHPKVLEEGNYWNDKYWGRCLKTGEGANWLGEILMDVRGEMILQQVPGRHPMEMGF